MPLPHGAGHEAEGERLFVTRIPPHLTREDIATHFAQFGSTTDVYLPAIPGKASHKGIAFISFQEPAAAQLAISNGPHVVGGNELVVDIAAPKGQAPHSQRHAAAPLVVHSQAPAPPKATFDSDRLFVTKVPPALTRDHMSQHFSQFGELTDVYMPAVPGSGTHKGICFISFADPTSLQLAMEHPHHEINGHIVVLDVAAPRGASSDKGGKGGHQAVAAPHVVAPPPQQGYSSYSNGGGQHGKGWGGYSGGSQAPPPPITSDSAGPPVPGRLFLTKVPPEVTKDDLTAYFQHFGALKDVYLPGNGKGIAFVSMEDPRVLEGILQTQQHFVKEGVPVLVDQARDRPPLGKGGKDKGKGDGSFYFYRQEVPPRPSNAHYGGQFGQFNQGGYHQPSYSRFAPF